MSVRKGAVPRVPYATPAGGTGAVVAAGRAPVAGARRRARTAEEFQERLAVQRRAGALEAFGEALDESEAALTIPPPVQRVRQRRPGVRPKLSAAAFELARQVYYLQHGTLADCARAIVAAGLSDTTNVTTVRERLDTWWARMQWPRRSTRSTFAIRDANNDGGLYRSQRRCVDVATGNGPAPKGKACAQSALPDSDYCFQHDPRPEYVQARRRQAERLREGRLVGMVALAPFQRWCDRERRRLLAEARASGPVHPNATGWRLLADAMDVDQSVLGRLMQGKHSAAGRPLVTRIKAETVARYVAPLGVEFRDVYGCDPPQRTGNAGLTCPRCGGRKNHESTTCRDCYEADQGVRCSYVNRRGKRCTVLTAHPSGFCAKCRRIVERIPKPRRGRQSHITTAMLILALGEYRDVPVMAWVAQRMWAVDASGVQRAFAHRKSLTGALVKQFRKRGWNTAQAAERAYEKLIAEHGPVPWPEGNATQVGADGMVPLEPFKAWLVDRKAEVGSYKRLAARTGLNADNISQWLRGVGVGAGKVTIRRATVDAALQAWGDGTTFADLYAEATA